MNTKSIFGIMLLAFSLFACGTEAKTSDVSAKVQDPTCSPQDVAGTTGTTGAAGTNGAVGPMGPQGPKGDKGDTGPQGLPGTASGKGDTGATGPAGAAGATGAQGPMGPAGAVGPKGPAGADGAGTAFSVATMYTRQSANNFSVNPTGSQTQWCDAGDILIGGGCLPINDSTHVTTMRGFGLQLDVPGNRMGYNCAAYSTNSTGSMSVYAICQAVN